MTGTSLPQLQSLLLDLLATERPVEPATVCGLGVPDWRAFLQVARRHRLGPQLHWRLTRGRSELPIPEPVLRELADDFKHSAMRALTLQRELLRTHRFLDQAGIRSIALKGAYLAFHTYPHPALRPLRDLDILVPEDEALRAYEVLLDAGFTARRARQSDLEAHLRIKNHLPPLGTPSGGVPVEVHARLTKQEHAGIDPGRADERNFWKRSICMDLAGEALPYLAPTDLLLHLIVHAAYDHHFSNGPLVLSDLAYLLQTKPIDWPLFWRQAEAGDQIRGCLLVLKMAQRYFGLPDIPWPAAVEADRGSVETLLESASLLTLRDFAARKDVRLDSEIVDKPTIGAKLGVLLRRFFPPREKIAARYPVAADSPRVYLWYVPNWWRLLSQRAPAYLASRRSAHLAQEGRQISLLNRWLESGSG